MISRFATCRASLLALGGALLAATATGAPVFKSYIVESHGSVSAAAAVQKVGGRVVDDLPIVDGVSARLTASQAAKLRKDARMLVFADSPVTMQSTTTVTPQAIDKYDSSFVGADKLAAQGFLGNGVTVAILDSGLWSATGSASGAAKVMDDLNGKNKVLATYDPSAGQGKSVPDAYGHGTHVASIIGSPDTEINGQPLGIAPMAKLVIVRCFNSSGAGSYSSVVNGLNWIFSHQSQYGIRVVNLSFGAAPQSYYWNDPIDQAVMKLWQSGVVVVASAGNFGPKPQTIAVPGNTPYVITVGAMTDNWTPTNKADDGVTSFSSTGPTFEGFVKPDVVAPGGHIVGIMDVNTMALAIGYPQFATASSSLFVMSGTSQAAAVTTGVVALMLQANPSLTPDQVKCRLMASASALVNANGKAAYSIFQQGAGLLNGYDAVYSQAANCANLGLNIANDINMTAHYGGPAHQNAKTGAFYVLDSSGNQMNADGYLWNQSFAKNLGYLWNQGYLWNSGYLWNQGYLWNNGYLWNSGYLWNQSTLTPASAPTFTESWNAEE